MQFQVILTPSAEADLNHFKVVEQRRIVAAIRIHLTTDADHESRRRKKLAENPLTPWELRVGDHRVFYEIEEDATVKMTAIGFKEHNELFIRGKRVAL
jgi:mRNA-degrading endonuclease RelE of RelBE toxin-antitoxin system